MILFPYGRVCSYPYVHTEHGSVEDLDDLSIEFLRQQEAGREGKCGILMDKILNTQSLVRVAVHHGLPSCRDADAFQMLYLDASP